MLVINNIQLSSDIYQITIESPEIAQKAVPGQFVAIFCKDLILRRPFSIANVEGNNLQVIYKTKGKGTEYISSLKSGNEVDIIGPLGTGFNITKDKALLVAGGVGIAPLIFLAKSLEKQQIPYNLLAGFQTLLNIPEIDIHHNYIVTEDSSSKYKGRVNDYLEEIIIRHKPGKIYSCGPTPVLKIVTDMAIKHNIEVEVALEKEFACGIGVCMGCSIQIKEDNKILNKRICKDGPVFDGRSVLW